MTYLFIYGLYVIIRTFFFEFESIFNVYVYLFTFMLVLGLSIFQTTYSFNKSEQFDINDYNLREDEEEIHNDKCKVFKYSAVQGNLILTNQRIIFIPEAKFDNFYFDIDINDIKDFSADRNMQPVIKLKDGNNYIIYIKNHFKFRSKFKDLVKSKIKSI